MVFTFTFTRLGMVRSGGVRYGKVWFSHSHSLGYGEVRYGMVW